jgi:hypothetical protein
MKIDSKLKAVAVGGVVLFGLVLGSGEAWATPIVDLMQQSANCSARAAELRSQAKAAEINANKNEQWMNDEAYDKTAGYLEALNIYFQMAKKDRDDFLRLTTEAQKLEMKAQIINQQIVAIQIGTDDNTLFFQKLPENKKERMDAEANMDRIRADIQTRHNKELEDARDMAGWMNDFWNVAIREAERKQGR